MANEKNNDDSVKKLVAAALATLLGGGSSYGGIGSISPASIAAGGILGSLGGGSAGGSYSGPAGSAGSAGAPSVSGGAVSSESAVKDSFGNASGAFVPFLVPVSTGASLTHNLVGKETPREGAHEQTVAEHTAHMKELVDRFYSEHPIPAGLVGEARKRVEAAMAKAALDYAIKEEPNTYYGYISQDMDGVKADERPRTVNGRTFNASSSWVGAVKRTSPNEVQVYLGASKNNPSGWYTYGGSAKQVEDFLTGDSLGREIGAIRKGGGTTLKKLW